MAKRKKPDPPKFKVGDWVTYPLRPDRMHAKVTEVRGALAPRGEQVYRIRWVWDWGEVHEFETVESALEPAAAPEHQPVPLPQESWAQWPR